MGGGDLTQNVDAAFFDQAQGAAKRQRDRLARTRRAVQDDDLARVEAQRDVVENLFSQTAAFLVMIEILYPNDGLIIDRGIRARRSNRQSTASARR